NHVVVDTVAHVRDPVRRGAGELDDVREEPRSRLLHAQALRRHDEVDVRPDQLLVLDRHVPGRADDEPEPAQTREAGNGVRVPLVLEEGTARWPDAEQLECAEVRLAVGDHRADERHQREPRHAALVGDALPVARLVDERLADVEDDRLYSHRDTRSRSSSVVTFSSRTSPSTTRTRPPPASTSEAQSVASPPRASAAGGAAAVNACGV